MKTQNYQAPKTERLNFKDEVRFVCTQGTSDIPDAPRRFVPTHKIP